MLHTNYKPTISNKVHSTLGITLVWSSIIVHW